tara:strand:+ start:69 stop:536 length:468 start_codon:yes stop_codon:yes gene_type:complete
MLPIELIKLKLQRIKEIAFKVTVMTCFFAITIFSAYSFGAALFETVSAISHDSVRVVYDQGAFYLLGATIGLLDLIWIMIYQGILMRELTKKVTNWFSKIAVAGILAAFILPVISHIIIEDIVLDKGYEVCTAGTNTWFYLSEIVYLKTGSDCLP